jgi:EAL domain-containing protein (putative c-di-GMP-specific phosphodiesterase class I)
VLPEPISLAVNLSGRQLLQPDLPEQLTAMLTRGNLSPRRLKLELTESIIMQEPSSTAARLQGLKDLGIQLAVDDFGTGHGLGKDAQDTAIVRSVVALAEELRMSVTAEGIETPAQWRQLRTLGCGAGQGYFFSGSVPAAQMRHLLAEAHAREAQVREALSRAAA